MYKGTIWMMALLLAASFTADVFAQQTDMTQNIPYTDTPPEIDGVLDDHYPVEGDGVFPMLNGRSGYEGWPENPEPFDLNGTAYAMWDEEYLYIIVIVDDDVLRVDATSGGDAWQDDSVELYIDGNNAKCESCYDDDDTQYRFRPGDPETGEPPMLFAANNQTEEGIIWTTRVNDDALGYVIEIALPWEKNGVTAQTNAIIGFDVHVNDDDEGGATRDGKLHWSDSPGDSQFQYADYFGTAVLVGGGGADRAIAQIRRSPSNPRIGQEVEFDASNSTAPGTIVTYEWDFGDGATASGEVVTHTFEAEGDYTVVLTVTDDGGISGTGQSVVTVYTDIGTLERPLEIPMALEAPVLDGVMEDVWNAAQRVELLNRANGDPPRDEMDLSVSAYLLWDDEGLYVLYDVTDDTLSNDSGDSWQDDTPEIYIDGLNEKNPVDPGYDDNDLQYEFGWNSNNPTGNSPNDGKTEGVAFAYTDKEDGTGYILEAFVPWVHAQVTPEVGHVFGLEIMINDDDSPEDIVGGRQTKLSWFAPAGQDVAWQNPSAFGNAILVTELGTAAEAPSELPGGFAIQSMYPNPFNPSTTALLRVEQPGEYTLTVYNVLGQRVLRETISVQSVGEMNVSLDLREQASGMYLFSLQSEATGKVATSRAMLLK